MVVVGWSDDLGALELDLGIGVWELVVGWAMCVVLKIQLVLCSRPRLMTLLVSCLGRW